MQTWQRRTQDGDSREFDDAGVFGKLQSDEGKFAARDRARAHCGVQHFECGAIYVGRVLCGRFEECADDFVEVCEGAEGVREADWRLWTDEGKTGGDGDSDFCS